MNETSTYYRERALSGVLILGGLVGITDPLLHSHHGVQPRALIGAGVGTVFLMLVLILRWTKAIRLVMYVAIAAAAVVFLGNFALYGHTYFFAAGFALPLAAAMFMSTREALWVLALYCAVSLVLGILIQSNLLVPPFAQLDRESVVLQNTINGVLIIIAITIPTVWKERLFADASLRERKQQRRLEAVFENGYGALIEANQQGRIEYAAGNLLEILGYSREAMLGQRILGFLSRDDRHQLLESMRQRGSSFTFDREVRVFDRSGNRRWVRLSGGGSSDSQPGRNWICAIQDVQEQVSQRERVFELSRLESLGNLCGGLAHDFNNLLTVIAFQSEQISDPEVKREIQSAQRCAAELTTGLLTFARKQEYQEVALDLRSFLSDFRKLAEHMLPGNIQLQWEISDAPLTIKMDPAQLQQVLINLLTNAQHATAGGGQLKVETYSHRQKRDSSASTPSPWAYLVVSDNGTGMTEETRERALEPFFTTKPRGKGTGLGLATVHGAVTRAGGRVMIDSQVGVGTRITIRFPLIDPMHHDAHPRRIEIPHTKHLSKNKPTVFVVEDREDVARNIRMILERAGFNVTVAGDAESAWEALSQRTVDLLVADIVLPGLSGIDLVSQVFERDDEIRAILISGHHQEDLSVVSRYPNRMRFFPKPFSSDQFLLAVNQLLAPHEVRRDAQSAPKSMGLGG